MHGIHIHRVRKKIRYDELEYVEKKYNSIIDAQKLEISRKEMMLKFMLVRSDLLLKVNNSNSSNSNNNNSTNKNNNNIHSNGNKGNNVEMTSSTSAHSWNFSFEADASSSCKSDHGPSVVDPSLFAAYKDILSDCSTFIVDVMPSGCSRRQISTAAAATTTLTNFHAFDIHLLNEINAKLDDEDSSCMFNFQIKRGQDGVAIDRSDHGFAECEFKFNYSFKEATKQQQQRQQQVVTLLTEFIQVKFAKESDKIVSMKILNTSDSIDSINVKDDFGHANFPSVVSLEQTCNVHDEMGKIVKK